MPYEVLLLYKIATLKFALKLLKVSSIVAKENGVELRFSDLDLELSQKVLKCLDHNPNQFFPIPKSGLFIAIPEMKQQKKADEILDRIETLVSKIGAF